MPTILLVDDQPLFRENLAEALEDHGFDVLQAEGATEAMEHCRSNPPDLLLLDIALPEMTGLELLQGIHSRSGMRRIPALFLTAFPREEYLEESHRLGASDFLVKSDISLQDLLHRIERRLDPSMGAATSASSLARRSPEEEGDEPRRHLRPALRRWRPAAPRPSMTRLFSLCCKPEVSAGEILHLVQLDAEMGDLLISAATSGPFRTEPRLRTAEEALTRIGIEDALHLLLTRTIIDLAGRGIPPRGDLVRLWAHAIASGLWAERLATTSAFPSPMSAFLAGLCSELPSVFSILALEEDYAEFRAQAWEDGESIQRYLAEVFETTPAHLALECTKSLELPEVVWKAVVDLQSGHAPISLWEPGPASRILEGASLLGLGSNQVWNPCVSIRTISCEESRWWREPEGLVHERAGIEASLHRLLEWEGVLPELSGPTRAIPSGQERRFLYLASATVFQPDPVASLLEGLGAVQILTDPVALGGNDDDVVRLAAVEPGTPLWNRILEVPRRVILLHRKHLPPDARLGPHVSIPLPATVALLEASLRPRG
ncbi:MAG: response regulator [Fibrobacteria bacterium]|nr:response regulator [Fibrobacteria bacterium]